MNTSTSRLTTLLGTASFLTIYNVVAAYAQQTAPATTQQQSRFAAADTLLTGRQQPQQVAQAGPPPQQAQAVEAVPEQVLVTGSLIHGAAAIGVPVTNLATQDFVETGALTTGELFRTIPAAIVSPGPSAVINGGQQERQTRVNLRGLDTTGPRSLLMVDGVRFPPQADGLCIIDPSIIPALALDRLDVLADGASATYGSDAIAGVINVVLKRGYDGALTLFHVQAPDAGGLQFQASQLYGRTWDGGDITLTYEWLNSEGIDGKAHSKYTLDYTPWGLDNQSPLGASIPGTISAGKPKATVGTVCSNCYAIPRGTGGNWAGGASGLGPGLGGNAAAPAFDWNAAGLNLGTTNVIDALKLGEESGAQQKNSWVATFDQRLLRRDGMAPGVSFFFTGFYTNRRVQFHDAPYYSNGVTNATKVLVIPTINPYYPSNAPSNLQVAYDLGYEVPTINSAYELSYRYSFGFNLDLPFDWSGQIYDSRSYESNAYLLRLVNSNYVKSALGANGAPPAGIPYLNVFCDPTKFTCNSATTLNYITAFRNLSDRYTIEEKGARFDGPLFELPAGQVKAAIGGTYESDNILGVQSNASGNAPDGTANPPRSAALIDPEPYTVWAGFVQLDIPIFGDNFSLPLVRKLDLEASWRHDQYQGTLNGGTSNPKIGFTWQLDEMTGATVRGSWGTSFRFANPGEYSVVLSDQNAQTNLPGQTPTPLLCINGAPPTGSAAADLFAAGFGCGSTSAGGIEWGGGPHSQLRVFTDPSGQTRTREGGTSLAPERATNYSVGLELAPTFDLLRGLDLQVTYYSIKINGVINPFNQITPTDLADPNTRFTFILPSDLGCPVATNKNPTACAPFEKMVAAAILDPNGGGDLSVAPNVFFIRDGSTTNSGFYHVDGLDFNASYNWDMGDYGAWNTGIAGTYYLHYKQQAAAGGQVIDLLHQNLAPANGLAQNGVETMPRLAYRARLGWSDGPYSVTGFVNYISHYFSPWAVPPNVNFACVAAGSSQPGGSFPCAISNYTTIEPSQYTFDLSLGYNTGDMPANDYLKEVTVQLTIQNLMGVHPAFSYGPVNSHRNAAGYDILKPDTGRIIGLTIQKHW